MVNFKYVVVLHPACTHGLCLLYRISKGKIKNCPCALPKHHSLKTYWGKGGIAPLSGQLHAPRKSASYLLHRRLGGPQSRSGRGGEEKIPSPRRESNPRTQIVQAIAQRYTNWAITYYYYYYCFEVYFEAIWQLSESKNLY
jgi:hypothetical protein